MIIDINGISVSIPNHISDWIKENEDNKTEFYGMLDSIMYAVKTFYKNKYKPNPYQKVYEEQLKDYMSCGATREQADAMIEMSIKTVENSIHDENYFNDLVKFIKNTQFDKKGE